MSVSFHTRTQFIDVIRALAQELGRPAADIEHDLDSALAISFELDGTVFELTHEPELNSSNLILECALGAAPGDEDALRGLLQANLDLLREGCGTLAWRDDTEEIVLLAAVGLRHAVPRTLAEAMHALAVQARQWRSGEMFELTPNGISPDAMGVRHWGDSLPGRDVPRIGRDFDKPVPRPPDPKPGADASPTSMQRARFLEIVSGLSATLEIRSLAPAGAAGTQAGFMVQLDAADAVIAHAHPAAAQLALEVDFGWIPPSRAASALVTLLELNRGLVRADGSGLGVDPASGKVIYRQSIPLDEPLALLPRLRFLDRQVAAWHARWYSTPEPGATAAADSPVTWATLSLFA